MNHTSADKKLFINTGLLFYIFASFFFSLKTYGQPQLPGKKETAFIDSIVTDYMTRNKVPGVSVAVVKSQHIVIEKGYGMANLEHFVPVTPSTVFRLASVSKPITAVAVMQLVEKGKLALDSPIQKYVPAFPLKRFPVTTRQLLSHLSGIRHYKGDEFSLNKRYKSLTEALDIFKADTLLHKPGDEQTYSTYGYTVLGVIIESISGLSFMDYLKQNIFLPAGMTQTYQDDPLQLIPGRSSNYDTIMRGIVRNSAFVNTSYKIPGGGLLSTVSDMSKFLIALQNGKLINLKTWQLMTTEVKTSKGTPTHYGLGWILGIPPFEGLPHLPNAVWHGGVQQGSTTAILILPDKNFAVVILSNLGELGNDITSAIARITSYLTSN